MKPTVLPPPRNGNGARRGILSLHSQVVDQLGRRIVGGSTAPGEALPTESELALELGVSRTVIREAMRVLAEKGVVSARPKIGTTVRPRESWRLNDPELLRWLFEEGIDPELHRDLLEIRRIIEPAAAALAAERGTEEEFKEIGQWLDIASEAPPQSQERNEADLGAHGAILGATHNEVLQALLGTLQAGMIASRDLTSRIPSNEIPLHRRVHDAMVARDSRAAEEAMRELLDQVESDLAEVLEQPAQQTLN